VVKQFTDPIARLSQAARAMADGHLDREIHVEGAQELASLARSFIRMRDAIREKMADLATRNEALRTSLSRQAALLDNIPDIAWLKDGESRFLAVNEPFGKACGVPPADLAGKTDLDIWPKDLAEAYRTDDFEVLRNGRRKQVVERLVESDGRDRWIETVKSPIFDVDGKAIGTAGIARDISERKRAEEEQAKLVSIIETSTDFIGIADLQGRLLYVNAAGRRLVGLDESEDVGSRRISEFLLEQDLARLEQELLPSVMKTGHWTGEFALRHLETGVPIPVEMNGFLIKDRTTGRPIAMANISRDITERKRAEAALRESRERLQLATHAGDIGIWDWDIVNDLLVWDDSMYRLYGIRREDFGEAYEAWSARLHPEDRERTEAEIQAALRGEREYAPEFRIVLPDGSVRALSAASQTFRDDQGKPVRMIGTNIDITERKRAEDELRESRNLLQAVLDTIPVRVFWKDLDLRYLGCNRPFAHDAGVSAPEDVIGKDDYQMGWREQADLYRRDDRRVLESGTPKLHYEEPQTTPAGLRIWLRTNKVPLRNAEGAIRGVLGTYEDITESKNAEESLRQAALIVENSPVMLFRWRAVEGWPVVLVSENVVSLGYSPIELIDGSTPFTAMVHPDDLGRVGREVHAYTESGTDQFQQEYRVITKDGRVRWVENRTMVERDEAGRVTHYQGIVVDITERRKAEAERERLIGELELRNAELERFTYTVSHDLKSPLITMRGFLGHLEKDALAGNTERLRADIGRITDATGKMDRLLRDLLELSRIGRVMNPPQEVPFEEIVREALGLVEGRLKERGIRIEVAAGMPAVLGDRVRLVEVVQNLVDNAAKFLGVQERPLIEVGVRDEERNGKPVFFVRDNGMGIEPQYQEKIFGLFNKLDPAAEGTGIGLALVKRIVEVHGGTIWVESKGGGGGATFCFTLPGAPTAAKNGGRA
jgi:PAS domain S-box-containing protein